MLPLSFMSRGWSNCLNGMVMTSSLSAAQGYVDERELRATCEAYGPVMGVTVVKTAIGHCKGFAFVDFRRSQHAHA